VTPCNFSLFLNSNLRDCTLVYIWYSESMARKTEKIFSYFAVFDPAREGGYNVSFPDLPGCVTFGKNFEEARKKAAEVLELWLAELAFQEKKISIPTRRPIIDEVRVALRV